MWRILSNEIRSHFDVEMTSWHQVMQTYNLNKMAVLRAVCLQTGVVMHPSYIDVQNPFTTVSFVALHARIKHIHPKVCYCLLE